MSALLLLACSAPAPETAGPAVDTGPTQATPWDYTSEETTDVFEPGAMQRELQELINDLRGYNAKPALDSWLAVRTYGDASCPAETIFETPENGTTTYFERLCLANEVTWFKGPLSVYNFEGNDLSAFEVTDIQQHVVLDGSGFSGMVMKGQTDVYETTSDLDYNCSCTAALATSEEPDANQWWTYTDGPTHWTGPEDDFTWMDEGIQSNMYLHFSRAADGGWWSVARGYVTGAGQIYGTVGLDLNLSGSTENTRACNTSGTLEATMRHTVTGRTATLQFGVDPSQECLACADVAEGLSPVCIDFTAFNDWEGSPW